MDDAGITAVLKADAGIVTKTLGLLGLILEGSYCG